LNIGARLDLRVCGVEALQSVIGLGEGMTARGYGPLGYGGAFVVQQALPNPVAVGLVNTVRSRSDYVPRSKTSNASTA